MRIVSLIRLSPADASRIRAVDGTLELVEAGGWFDGEYAQTWPAATTQRYVSSPGQGSRQERDAMLAGAQIVLAGFPQTVMFFTNKRLAGICWIVPPAKPTGMIRPSGAMQRSDCANTSPPTGS